MRGSLTGELGVSVRGNVSMLGASCTTTGILEVEDGELSFDAISSWRGHDIRISGSGVIRVAGGGVFESQGAELRIGPDVTGGYFLPDGCRQRFAAIFRDGRRLDPGEYRRADGRELSDFILGGGSLVVCSRGTVVRLR